MQKYPAINLLAEVGPWNLGKSSEIRWERMAAEIVTWCERQCTSVDGLKKQNGELSGFFIFIFEVLLAPEWIN